MIFKHVTTIILAIAGLAVAGCAHQGPEPRGGGMMMMKAEGRGCGMRDQERGGRDRADREMTDKQRPDREREMSGCGKMKDGKSAQARRETVDPHADHSP